MTSELFTRTYLTIFTSESCQASGASFLVRRRDKTRDERFSSAFRAKNEELHDSQLVSDITHARPITITWLLKWIRFFQILIALRFIPIRL